MKRKKSGPKATPELRLDEAQRQRRLEALAAEKQRERQHAEQKELQHE